MKRPKPRSLRLNYTRERLEATQKPQFQSMRRREKLRQTNWNIKICNKNRKRSTWTESHTSRPSPRISSFDSNWSANETAASIQRHTPRRDSTEAVRCLRVPQRSRHPANPVNSSPPSVLIHTRPLKRPIAWERSQISLGSWNHKEWALGIDLQRYRWLVRGHLALQSTRQFWEVIAMWVRVKSSSW